MEDIPVLEARLPVQLSPFEYSLTAYTIRHALAQYRRDYPAEYPSRTRQPQFNIYGVGLTYHGDGVIDVTVYGPEPGSCPELIRELYKWLRLVKNSHSQKYIYRDVRLGTKLSTPTPRENDYFVVE